MFVSSIIRKFIFLTNSVLEATAMKPIMVFKFTFFILLHIFLCSRINLHKYGEKVKVVNWFITVLYIFCTTYWTMTLKIQMFTLWLSNLRPTEHGGWVSFPRSAAWLTELVAISHGESSKSVSLSILYTGKTWQSLPQYCFHAKSL